MLDLLKRMKKVLGVKSDKDLAESLSIANVATIYMWKQRERVPYEFCDKIAEKYNISLDWLMRGKGEMYLNNKKTPILPAIENTGRVTSVNKYDVVASAGSGAVIGDENIIGQVPFNTEYLKSMSVSDSKLAVIEASGDSMEPILKAGDNLLVDLGQYRRQIIDGLIYVCRLQEYLVVKTISPLLNNKIKVSSFNKEYESYELNLTDGLKHNFEIIGRVIWFGRVID
jgi:phage repressor protein C with HTH and peptisase S24 domain